jgi:hypothetical protein
MKRFPSRLRLGWLVLGLALVLAPAARARTASGQDAAARLNAHSASAHLSQSAQANRRAATSGNAIRAAVRTAFLAINAANKRLYACKWGSCTKASKKLRRVALHWVAVLRPLKAKTKAVARGLGTAKTSLMYWNKTGFDAVRTDAAAKAKKQPQFNSWYRRYKTHYKLGVKYQNRAVSILSR